MASANLLFVLCLLGANLNSIAAKINKFPAVANNSPQDFMVAHNAVRAQVGIEPLHWNTTLAAYAQNYANTKIATCQMDHSKGPYGENVAKGFKGMTAETAVKLWTAKKKFINYGSSTSTNEKGRCGHQTQVEWRNTKSVGCAQVKCPNDWVLVICNYDPPCN